MTKLSVQTALWISGHSTMASIVLLLLRLVAGSAFILHGWQKVQNPVGWMGPESSIPGFFQFLAAISEFGGGIGWETRSVLPESGGGGDGCSVKE